MSAEKATNPSLEHPQFKAWVEDGLLKVTYEKQYRLEADPKTYIHRTALSIPLIEGIDQGLQLLFQFAPQLIPETLERLQSYQQTYRSGTSNEPLVVNNTELTGITDAKPSPQPRPEPSKKLAKKERENELKNEFAHNIIERYEQEVTAYETPAREKIVQVIYPWWQELRSSKTFEKLFPKTRQYHISLPISQPIYIFWPVDQLSKYKTALTNNRDPWAAVATDIGLYYPKEGVAKALGEVGYVVRYPGFDWDAQFYIVPHPKQEYHALEIFPQSQEGPRCGFSSSPYRVVVTFDDTDRCVKSINPKIYIKFAEAIESGEVNTLLARALKKDKKL